MTVGVIWLNRQSHFLFGFVQSSLMRGGVSVKKPFHLPLSPLLLLLALLRLGIHFVIVDGNLLFVNAPSRCLLLKHPCSPKRGPSSIFFDIPLSAFWDLRFNLRQMLLRMVNAMIVVYRVEE